jgi:predicted RNase H-like HicB family nuclease
MKFPVIYEATPNGFSAYAPDLPGCVAAGTTLAEARDLISGAIALHITGMREDGESIPEPSVFEFVDVAV